MAAKASSQRARLSPQACPETTHRVHRAASARMRPVGETTRRGALPAMRASARRRNAVGAADAKPPKPKRAKRVRNLGGRLAAAIRMARLRARRAAEEHRGARR